MANTKILNIFLSMMVHISKSLNVLILHLVQGPHDRMPLWTQITIPDWTIQKLQNILPLLFSNTRTKFKYFINMWSEKYIIIRLHYVLEVHNSVTFICDRSGRTILIYFLRKWRQEIEDVFSMIENTYCHNYVQHLFWSSLLPNVLIRNPHLNFTIK